MDEGEPVPRFARWLVPLIAAAWPAQAADYGAWRKVNPDGGWTRAAEQAVSQTALPYLEPRDVQEFCAAYPSLAAPERQVFWAGLLSAMARPESNFKPETTYVEPHIVDAHGQNVVSRGLLQISIESANQKAYGCGVQAAKDLHVPEVNLRCGARILAHWVKSDGVIGAAAKPARGGGRYWSVLRSWSPNYMEVRSFTSKMAVCQP